ncbi:membrane protein [Litorimonas cladophorae]|uniref:Membrane protein n=1 Tax=Litorimonas cladophorae TaxID=1220491 RepID=A0A918NC36_9PROT|nr:MAPEG family protein [Litorimonas cladophorae]GGX56961.1 membrane protein [Litorimonas cladophorae]
MTHTTFLAPVLALIIWTLLIWALMYARRIPAMQKAKIDPDTAKSPDGPWKQELPLSVQASAHNYNHLMEQPTIFYAFMFYITLTSQMTTPILYAAWAYVALRVLHSFVQVSAGKVMLRFGLFSVSTLVLFAIVAMVLI